MNWTDGCYFSKHKCKWMSNWRAFADIDPINKTLHYMYIHIGTTDWFCRKYYTESITLNRFRQTYFAYKNITTYLSHTSMSVQARIRPISDPWSSSTALLILPSWLSRSLGTSTLCPPPPPPRIWPHPVPWSAQVKHNLGHCSTCMNVHFDWLIDQSINQCSLTTGW